MEQIIRRIKSFNNVFEIRPKENLERYHFISPIRIKLEVFPFLLPNDLKVFYQNLGYAELFVDGMYGQSGIRLYNPYQALQATQMIELEEGIELLNNELIIGDFIGDSDRILLSENKVSIILPMYNREDWLHTGYSFEEFLAKILDCNGEKYWEL
ncbi:MAG: hypothetical protein MUE99_11185 [Chitinophagaceae bacterium]|jgi:hypothetical protein|nr:hypothetical protein [Chitinophagaceae bacterium]